MAGGAAANEVLTGAIAPKNKATIVIILLHRILECLNFSNSLEKKPNYASIYSKLKKLVQEILGQQKHQRALPYIYLNSQPSNKLLSHKLDKIFVRPLIQSDQFFHRSYFPQFFQLPDRHQNMTKLQILNLSSFGILDNYR